MNETPWRLAMVLAVAALLAACGGNSSRSGANAAAREPGWGACASNAFWATRCARASALNGNERVQILTDFFSAYPGVRAKGAGYGQAIIDFTEWEIRSGRMSQGSGAGWWKVVNGLMVLDLRDAMSKMAGALSYQPLTGVRAWIAYANGARTNPGRPNDPTVQAALWTAHQDSIHGALRAAVADYTATVNADAGAGTKEAAIEEIVVRNVDTAAINQDSTAPPVGALIGFATHTFYPEHYPGRTADVIKLGLGSAVGHGVLDIVRDDRAQADVGMCSTRWDPAGFATDCPLSPTGKG